MTVAITMLWCLKALPGKPYSSLYWHCLSTTRLQHWSQVNRLHGRQVGIETWLCGVMVACWTGDHEVASSTFTWSIAR